MRRARENGAMIAGTSAGAAVMSRIMMTGNSLKDTTKRSTFPVLRAGNLELSTGLAFLDSVIIDQHFLERSRFNRLLSAKIEHPAYDCIGIEESTALTVNGSSATVAGRNQVVVIGLSKDIHVSPSGRLAARNMPV
jgi:cyanophycinase